MVDRTVGAPLQQRPRTALELGTELVSHLLVALAVLFRTALLRGPALGFLDSVAELVNLLVQGLEVPARHSPLLHRHVHLIFVGHGPPERRQAVRGHHHQVLGRVRVAVVTKVRCAAEVRILGIEREAHGPRHLDEDADLAARRQGRHGVQGPVPFPHLVGRQAAQHHPRRRLLGGAIGLDHGELERRNPHLYHDLGGGQARVVVQQHVGLSNLGIAHGAYRRGKYLGREGRGVLDL